MRQFPVVAGECLWFPALPFFRNTDSGGRMSKTFVTGLFKTRAAAEAAVGLALIISIYRHYKTTNLDQIDSMRG